VSDAGPDSPIPRVIPLFPLPNVVLFPQMAMPLHIFEPRYKKMIEDARAGPGVIGMTLLRPGWEPDYHGRPPIYPIGCAGHMEEVQEVASGRYNILLKGVSRYRILQEHAGEPYRLAQVEALRDLAGDDRDLDAARRAVMAAVGRAADGPAVMVLQKELPHDLFVNALCQSLPLVPVERQSLLDCESIQARYERLLEIMEFRLLESTWGNKGGVVH
jgi:Lon protease-like protein